MKDLFLHDSQDDFPVVFSDLVLYTPTSFAKTALLYLQEIGSLQAKKPHTSSRTRLFFAEAKCRLLQNVMYVDCCKQTLGATPPNPCKINGCGKLEPTFTTSVDSAITYKWVLQFSVFYFCNKHPPAVIPVFLC